MVKNLPANAVDIKDEGWIPGLGGSPGGGHSNSLQYSCPENSMDTGAWWTTVYGVTKSRTQSSVHAQHTLLPPKEDHFFFFFAYYFFFSDILKHIFSLAIVNLNSLR